MKIEGHEKIIHFGDTNIGDVMLWNGNVIISIDTIIDQKGDRYNAVDLSNGFTYTVSVKDEVKPLNEATLYINGKEDI